MHYLPDGTVIPNLVEQVPTVENGLLKEDLTGFTATTQRRASSGATAPR